MSYGANGANGYGNGYRPQQPSTRYEEDRRDPSAGSRSREGRPRRTGGYGGFQDEEPERPGSRPNGQNRPAYNNNNSGTNPYANAPPDPYSDPYGPPPPIPASRRPRDPNMAPPPPMGREQRPPSRDPAMAPPPLRDPAMGRPSSRDPVMTPPSNRDPTSFRPSSRDPGTGRGPYSREGMGRTPPVDREPPPGRGPSMSAGYGGGGGGGVGGGGRDRLRPPGSSAGDRRLYGEGPAGRQIEEVVEHINDKWSILTKDNCVPAQVALQLMDTSSLGRGNDYDDFVDSGQALQRSLKAVVNEHHQGFNSSIGTFHKIQASIQSSQDKVRTLKDSIVQSTSNLTDAKPELGELATASQNYDEMLQIIGHIEKIQLMPEQLDSRISEKHFITAVDVLQDALRLIRHSSLENIGALADLKVYLSNQETSLTDILLEELHDHLYLKSPYCASRWKEYNPSESTDNDGGVSNLSTGIRPMYRFLTNLDTSVPMVDDATRNPEEDSFEYIHMIIEALNKMGRLELAVDRMEQRLPLELFAVVEKTNQEVDHRHPAHLRANQARDWTRTSLKSTKSDTTEAVLNDLLQNLYSKFEAIAEGHRAVHEVIEGIVVREGLKKTDALTKGFKELWKLYQSEMRALLHDYLATDGNPLYGSRDGQNGATNIFRKNHRDKNKKVFKLDDLDKKSTQLAAEQEELDKILQASVPGLVARSNKRTITTTENKTTVSHDSPAAGHKLLVEPSVFNISVLLPPSLVFLQRLKDTVPPESDIAVSTLTSFLDDFLVNVFNPQLDDTIAELCSQTFMQIDAFQEDPHWAEHSKMPIFKGTTMFYTLVKEFCKMLDNIPQDQMFTQLILNQLGTYYDRCMTWSETILSRASQEEGHLELKPAADLLRAGGEFGEHVKAIWATEGDEQSKALQVEVDQLVKKTNEKPIGPFDIICDRRSAASLCLLYSSMQWLAGQLQELRHVVKKDTNAEPKQGRGTKRWTMLSAATMRDGNQPVNLPLTEESVGPFDQVLTAYRNLATKALQILHVDLRLNVIQQMSNVLESHYTLDQPVNEPDPSIIQLNNDLLMFDDIITDHLPQREYNFMTSGLALLLDSYIVTNSSKIKDMNENGCDRMQLNILVLQQNLRSVEKEVMLSRSAQYFDYFKQGPKAIVQRAKDTGGQNLGFNLDELKVLVELCYSEGLNSQQREVASQAKRAMGENSLQLTEYMWSI